jgi:hypothetical protein
VGAPLREPRRPGGGEHRDALSGRGSTQHHRPALPRPGVPGAQLRRQPAQCAPPEAGDGLLREAGWSRERLTCRLHELLQIPGSQLVRGADGIAEGLPEQVRDATLPKFRPDGILLVHCGGGAGLFSCIIAGWVGSGIGSQPVVREIGT